MSWEPGARIGPLMRRRNCPACQAAPFTDPVPGGFEGVISPKAEPVLILAEHAVTP